MQRLQKFTLQKTLLKLTKMYTHEYVAQINCLCIYHVILEIKNKFSKTIIDVVFSKLCTFDCLNNMLYVRGMAERI